MTASRDLVALVADSHQHRVLQVLLTSRRDALALCTVSFDVYRHPRADPGVYSVAHAFLTPFRETHRFALVLLDARFPGSPGAPAEVEVDIQKRLDIHGWSGRSAVVVIAPELEAWVWSDSPHVEQVLGQSHAQIRGVAEQHGWWSTNETKPSEPKELLSVTLRASRRRPPSAALFGELAERVSLRRCTDPAFRKLRDTLQRWFPAA